MKLLYSFTADFRLAYSILARRIAFPLLLLSVGLLLVQPCAGQSGTWLATGSLNTASNKTIDLNPKWTPTLGFFLPLSGRQTFSRALRDLPGWAQFLNSRDEILSTSEPAVASSPCL